jgi:hypothetical protein
MKEEKQPSSVLSFEIYKLYNVRKNIHKNPHKNVKSLHENVHKNIKIAVCLKL